MQSDADLIRDWLRHPAAKLVAKKFRKAAKDALRKYDSCADEKELYRLQITRKVLLNTIPDLLDGMTHKPEEKPFGWRRFLGL